MKLHLIEYKGNDGQWWDHTWLDPESDAVEDSLEELQAAYPNTEFRFAGLVEQGELQACSNGVWHSSLRYPSPMSEKHAKQILAGNTLFKDVPYRYSSFEQRPK